jgi:hypothetical protein
MKLASDRAVPPGRHWNRITYPLRAACVLLPTLLFLGLAWIDYRDELGRTRIDVQTATNAVAEHARTVIETTSLVLARVLEHIDQQDWDTLATSSDTHEFLNRLRHELPQIEAVYLIDPDGVIAASSRAYPMPRYDVHAMEYFAVVKAQDSDSLVVTAPFSGTISGTTGFMVSRRRVRNGRFDGVVGVTVSRQYFEAFYAGILDDPAASAAGIFRTDGAILIRVPESPLTMVSSTSPVMAAVGAGTEAGMFSGPSSQDGREHIVGFQRLRDLPLVAGYEIDRSVLLTRWAIHAAVIGACAILLSVLLLATEHLVRRNAAVDVLHHQRTWRRNRAGSLDGLGLCRRTRRCVDPRQRPGHRHDRKPVPPQGR